MKKPTIPFSALRAEYQEQITNLLKPLSGEFKYDLHFGEDLTIVSTEEGYTLEELRTWSQGTKYFELSTTDKRRVLKAIETALPNDWVACLYSEASELYNVGIFEEEPNHWALWNEIHSAQKWLQVLGLNGPDAPSGDSCLSLEIEALEGELVETGE